jgi:hypothetical protein
VFRRYRELWYALAAIVAVTAVYLLAYRQAGRFPAASGLIGHGIGVLGFALMLMAETLYSIRKLQTDARWGNMAGWLRFHIFAGLVGPYMVLLHTTMRFRGLAGVSMLLTVVVVVSGFIGRYIYTAVPREINLGDAEPTERDHVRRVRPLASQRGALASWRGLHVPVTWALFAAAFVHAFGALFYATLQR